MTGSRLLQLEWKDTETTRVTMLRVVCVGFHGGCQAHLAAFFAFPGFFDDRGMPPKTLSVFGNRILIKKVL